MAESFTALRVLVCGGRDYADRAAVSRELEGYRQQTPHLVVIEGGASGADRFASDWCGRNGVECWHFPADWDRHGKAAGPIRNAAMLAKGKPDVVVAFPRANGQWGSGTLNMIRQAEKAGVPVVRIAPSDPHPTHPGPHSTEGA